MTATAAAAAATAAATATTTALVAGKRGLLGTRAANGEVGGFCGGYRRGVDSEGGRRGEEWAEGAVEAMRAARKGGQQSSCHALKYVPR